MHRANSCAFTQRETKCAGKERYRRAYEHANAIVRLAEGHRTVVNAVHISLNSCRCDNVVKETTCPLWALTFTSTRRLFVARAKPWNRILTSSEVPGRKEAEKGNECEEKGGRRGVGTWSFSRNQSEQNVDRLCDLSS